MIYEAPTQAMIDIQNAYLREKLLPYRNKLYTEYMVAKKEHPGSYKHKALKAELSIVNAKLGIDEDL